MLRGSYNSSPTEFFSVRALLDSPTRKQGVRLSRSIARRANQTFEKRRQ